MREQFYLLLIDQDAALAAIPKMLPEDTEVRRLALDAIKRVLTAFGPLDGQDHERLERIARLFNLGNTAVSVETSSLCRRRDPKCKAGLHQVEQPIKA